MIRPSNLSRSVLGALVGGAISCGGNSHRAGEVWTGTFDANTTYKLTGDPVKLTLVVSSSSLVWRREDVIFHRVTECRSGFNRPQTDGDFQLRLHFVCDGSSTDMNGPNVVRYSAVSGRWLVSIEGYTGNGAWLSKRPPTY